MQLSQRPAVYALPSYSLTGDLLGFLRCGLQYRYTRIGKLPSTRPVQAWFGQFIHGVLEESYRRFDESRKRGAMNLPPWSEETIAGICELIKKRLAAQQLFPWGADLEELGYARAKVAVNELGPQLFPLIHRAEVRLTGARALPLAQIPPEYRFREADRYEMMGVIDVVTNVQLYDPDLWGNLLVKELLTDFKARSLKPPGEFEVIIDYKGMRRPSQKPIDPSKPSFWDIYGWQAQTYAHLRQAQEDSLPVMAGVIIYLNELLPTKGDLRRLREEIANGETDVVPEPGSETEQLLREWKDRKGEEPPILPFEFRLKRGLRVLPVAEATIAHALQEFDSAVARIEICRGKELQQGRVLSTWEKNAEDESTCAACDARTFCPSYTAETEPKLPGVRT
ncbi:MULTISPECIES: PD-(D/E)XK nuclease family protein [Trichocoleus]|uniref:PD-(D/E)XK nuclease family protein n=1 Tax=Trichocoleus desertorum GB2-A4 TaxID=2933944 RepID=A0ABV0JC30_9CYAN|nr:PD-(D/E)XK nuclease family protein [Trichocoleus sp. FACHB-46]MBD1863987.1 PD-(D/E)XK nuclease family protein [Trichocoleus sp. FACHB-46]